MFQDGTKATYYDSQLQALAATGPSSDEFVFSIHSTELILPVAYAFVSAFISTDARSGQNADLASAIRCARRREP
jgi:hypothetical protein